uniref:Uncharacterized protein n=1 Tax=viral metagenome TaxID=1070528 RepID=A0A6C0F9R6_9ZZZZ
MQSLSNTIPYSLFQSHKKNMRHCQMKLVKIKPRLVDPDWFAPKVVKPVQPKIKVVRKITTGPPDFSIYYNCIGLLIIGIAVFYMYQRYTNKDEILQENRQKIVSFNQYVQDNLRLKSKENKSTSS